MIGAGIFMKKRLEDELLMLQQQLRLFERRGEALLQTVEKLLTEIIALKNGQKDELLHALAHAESNTATDPLPVIPLFPVANVSHIISCGGTEKYHNGPRIDRSPNRNICSVADSVSDDGV
jgi:hypothetical protein